MLKGKAWGLERGRGLRRCAATNCVIHRHSRAFLHALLHSDNTTALHHLTVHNIAYQVTWTSVGRGHGALGQEEPWILGWSGVRLS